MALFFGLLLILVTFGDSRFRIETLGSSIGNLDSIFGQMFWPAMDVVLPLATIVVFLLYGWSKQDRFRINIDTVFLFLSFLTALFLIIIDDITQGMGVSVQFPQMYWIAVSWFYPVYSAFAFVLFGKAHEKKFG